MCQDADRCAFYAKYKNAREGAIRRLLREYCESDKSCSRCRRQLIRQYYDVNLSPAIGPAGDYLEFC